MMLLLLSGANQQSQWVGDCAIDLAALQLNDSLALCHPLDSDGCYFWCDFQWKKLISFLALEFVQCCTTTIQLFLENEDR